MIVLKDAIATLHGLGDAQKAAEMAAYHKAPRPYIGVANPPIFDAVQVWRDACTLDDRLTLAAQLWDSNIHEARIAAARLLVQARINPDDRAWALIAQWVAQLDNLAIADQVCGAGSRRLVAHPARLDEVEAWTTSQNLWTKRAAIVMTQPWTKMNNPKPADLAVRERVLGWAATYASDPAPIIQKALSGWLAELGRHDAARVWAFLDEHGSAMKPSAVKDASRKLPAR